MLRSIVRQLQPPNTCRNDLLLQLCASAPYLKDSKLGNPPSDTGRGGAFLFLPRPYSAKTLLSKLKEDLSADFILTLFNSRCFRSTHDLHLMHHALQMTALAHQGQVRESGEPYLVHPVETARFLSSFGVETDTLVAALLHDTVEDQTLVTLTDIRTEFGLQVMKLVDAVTKIGPSVEAAAENQAKLAMAIAVDPKVGLLKLCDRWNNLLSLSVLSPSRQLRIAQDTVQFFVPLSQRLGLLRLKHHLLRVSNFYIDLQRDNAAQ